MAIFGLPGEWELLAILGLLVFLVAPFVFIAFYVRESRRRRTAAMLPPQPVEPDLPPDTRRTQGWYADPSGKHDRRFWDGQQWTADVSDAGSQSSDPMQP